MGDGDPAEVLTTSFDCAITPFDPDLVATDVCYSGFISRCFANISASPSKTPPSYDRAPPICGQDTEAILKEVLDLDEQAIAKLKASQITG